MKTGDWDSHHCGMTPHSEYHCALTGTGTRNLEYQEAVKEIVAGDVTIAEGQPKACVLVERSLSLSPLMRCSALYNGHKAITGQRSVKN
jgi:hypothetical protein